MRSAFASALVLLLAASAAGLAQERETGSVMVWFAYAPHETPQDDPAYTVYRKGYGLVMEERWVEAHRIFEELQQRFPRSSFADDAAYWSAYALSQIDRRKAIESYQRFFRKYPRSRYVEEATVDFAALRATEAPAARLDSMAEEFERQNHLTILQEHRLRSLELVVQRMNRALRFGVSSNGLILIEEFPPAATQLDEEMRHKLESLVVRGETRGDEQAFRTLQEMARDTRKPPTVRSVAVRSLARLSRFDPLPVLVEVARTDTSWSVQEAAILSIGQAPVGPDRALETLARLYAQLPDPDDQRRLAVLDAAATVGTPRAVTFLAQVARNATDSVLQATAIDNITAAGRDTHRNVELLIELYRSLPAERRSARATALYGVAEMGTDRAVDFLVDVARNDRDRDLRRDAVIYLGAIGGPKARGALREVLQSP